MLLQIQTIINKLNNSVNLIIRLEKWQFQKQFSKPLKRPNFL